MRPRRRPAPTSLGSVAACGRFVAADLALLEIADGEELQAELRRRYLAELRRVLAEERRGEQLRAVSAETKRLLRLRRHLEEERVDPQYGLRLRRSGEAILSHLHEIKQGTPCSWPSGWAPDGGDLSILLDPARTPADNADILLPSRPPLGTRRAAPQASARGDRPGGGPPLDPGDSDRARRSDPPGDESFPARLDEALGLFRQRRPRPARGDRGTPRSSPRPRPAPARSRPAGGPADAARRGAARPRGRRPDFHPRSYQTKDGWTVLVGRSNQENDYLTHRLAHPEDYWFHAHGVPGSHVVLRREGRKDNPSAKTIEEAAAIAAFFSKARHSSKAPVIYTLKKYVRKPRGAKAGLAMCQREKSIMVLPKDPAEGREPEWMEE